MNLDLFDGARAARALSSDVSASVSSAEFAAAPTILAAATALPPNVVEQQSLAGLLKALWGEKYDQSRRWRSTFEQIQRSVRIDRRYLALPVSEYPALDSFAKTNSAWTRVAPELGAAAATSALAAAGMTRARRGSSLLRYRHRDRDAEPGCANRQPARDAAGRPAHADLRPGMRRRSGRNRTRRRRVARISGPDRDGGVVRTVLAHLATRRRLGRQHHRLCAFWRRRGRGGARRRAAGQPWRRLGPPRHRDPLRLLSR